MNSQDIPYWLSDFDKCMKQQDKEKEKEGDLSSDKVQAIRKIQKWFRDEKEKRVCTVGGLAGTGKTRLIREIPEALGISPRQIVFCATTNAAKYRLQKELNKHLDDATVITVHSFCRKYLAGHDEKCETAKNWKAKCSALDGCELTHVPKENDAILLICDESSMIDDQLMEDLINTDSNIKILLTGDPGQLPPVGKNQKNIMRNADIELIKIHRQARDSGIITVATMAREGKKLPYGSLGNGVWKIPKNDFTSLPDTSTVGICYYNISLLHGRRVMNVPYLNKVWRKAIGRSGRPEIGDRVILERPVRVTGMRKESKRTFKGSGATKGSLGTIARINFRLDKQTKEEIAEMEVKLDNIYKPIITEASVEFFENSRGPDGKMAQGREHLELWSYGYVITGHKSQGSEFDSVVVFEPEFYLDNYNEWMYTAITRAKKHLIIVG